MQGVGLAGKVGLGGGSRGALGRQLLRVLLTISIGTKKIKL